MMQSRIRPTTERSILRVSLFRKLAHEIPKEYYSGPFYLYCDDLRPDNVLIDTSSLVVTGVVDWEFSYAALVEYTLAAP